jgi:hypothetical protein
MVMSLFVSLQAIHGATSQSVLEEAKAHFQEQLLRKAAQREADAAMDEEQKRCVHVCARVCQHYRHYRHYQHYQLYQVLGSVGRRL